MLRPTIQIPPAFLIFHSDHPLLIKISKASRLLESVVLIQSLDVTFIEICEFR